ncbi:hypothetical protein ACFLTB_02415 [Chloroflexota bacterium]
MLNEVLLYIGSGVIIIWGIAHLIPTKAIVNGFVEISEDNKKILTMELIAEGLTLIFLGVLVLLVSLVGGIDNEVSTLVLWASVVMLLIMALLTALTGARTAGIPYKICPFVKTAVGVLIILGILL